MTIDFGQRDLRRTHAHQYVEGHLRRLHEPVHMRPEWLRRG
jgi:hypothetical protein